MYGLVNKAIEGLVCEEFGEETWERIVEEAGVEEDTFVSLDAYDDAITYSLVGAASKVLDTPADQLLQAFGAYWTKYVGREGYGPLMALEDKPLGQFLAELNDEVEDIRLDGRIKTSRWLIEDEQRGIAGQRHGDCHPLLHAA